MKKYDKLTKELMKSHRLAKHVIMLDEIEGDTEEEMIDSLYFWVGWRAENLAEVGHENSKEYGDGSLGTMRVINNLIKKLQEFERNREF